MRVVSNSGPLINLSKVGRLDLLTVLFQRVMIPMEVFEEVAVRGAGQPGAEEIRTARWVIRRQLKRSDTANLLTAELDRGEAAAIALALQEKADWLLIDELIGRRFARQAGLKVKGTLGILVEGVRRGPIEDLRPVLDEMLAKGTWIAPATYEQVLRLTQEIQRSPGKKKRP